MPTIKFALEDLNKLVGRKLTSTEVEHLVEYGKGELKDYSSETDELQVNFDDTNLPYLWSVEGFARLVRGALGVETGLPKLNLVKSDYKVVVNKSVKAIRPYISAIGVRGKPIDDYFLKQIIQLQEKFCDSYGVKRKKVALGVYSLSKIKFPVFYKAVEPESVEFEPLGFKRKMTPGEILEMHPAGQLYAHLLKGLDKYPILVDDNNEVLSFPPVINSNHSGKIEVGETELFVEATGDDADAVNLAINIFAQAFSDRGYEIYPVEIEYDDHSVKCPYNPNEKIKLKGTQVTELLGLELNESAIKKLLEKARYGYNDGTVTIPLYRQDIMHWVDIVEDIAIMYGFNEIPVEELTHMTIGSTSPQIVLNDKMRDFLIGFGYQEVLNAMLSNKDTMFTKMEMAPYSLLEIKDYMSESYSVVRNSLIPVLMEVLSKNKHNEYPQRVFEQGLVSLNLKTHAVDQDRIAAASTHSEASYTEMKQVFEGVMRSLGLTELEYHETEHNSFIAGRVAKIVVKGREIGLIGEIAPKVITNWGLDTPVAAFELNLTELMNVVKK